MLFHRIMSANTKEIRLTWDADHPRLYKLKKGMALLRKIIINYEEIFYCDIGASIRRFE